MKRTAIVLLTFAVVTLWSSQAISSEKEIIGAIIGASSGAIIGHAIGGDAESAIIGSAIGGAVGAGAVHAHRHGVPVPFPPFIVPPRPYQPSYDRYPPRHYRGDRHYDRDRGCRIVRKHTYRHGHHYVSNKRVCRSDRRYYNDRHWDRHDYRHDDRW